MAAILKDRVKETSTSTGTGALTVAGAPAGFRAFSAVCAVGDTFRYTIQGVDASGMPTGEWECGIGTYSAANTITRTTVVDSSNAGAVVTLSAGAKQVWIGLDAGMAGWARERLTAARTYYVRTDGSDSNTGLANTAGGAFLTIQKAVDVAAGLDTNIYDVTIQVADGTYAASVVLKNTVGAGKVILLGNTTTPANVVITGGAPAISKASPGTAYSISGFKVTSTSYSFYISGAAVVDIGYIDFGAATSGCVISATNAYVSFSGPCTISGNSPIFLRATTAGVIGMFGVAITISGSRTFSSVFAYADNGGILSSATTTFPSGTVTGKRYQVDNLALINVYGVGASYFPGTVAGTTSVGAQYA